MRGGEKGESDPGSTAGVAVMVCHSAPVAAVATGSSEGRRPSRPSKSALTPTLVWFVQHGARAALIDVTPVGEPPP